MAIEDIRGFTLHFGFDGGQNVQNREAAFGPFNKWSVTLSDLDVEPHKQLNFTRHYDDDWEDSPK